MRKKIIFLIPTLTHGGAEKVLVNLVNNLDREKYDVTVKTLFDVGVNKTALKPFVKYESVLGFQFRGNSWLIKLLPAKLLWKHIVKEHYDIAVSYLEGPTTRILSGCDDPDTKRVAWLHIELNTPSLAAIGFRSVKEAEKAYNSFDNIIAVAQSVKDCFQQNINVTRNIDVLYNTNETEQIIEKSHQPINDPLFKTDLPTICSIGRLMKPKGFDRLIQVHRRLLDEGYRHRVYVLGVGDEKAALERQIAQQGVEDTFILLGFRENPYPYIANSDFFVCSSRREGFSTAVTESLVIGTPVVSTNCSGAKELLGENNEYGIVVENSADGIYAGMKKMLSEPELISKYKELAAERGLLFNREQTVKEVEKMLDAL